MVQKLPLLCGNSPLRASWGHQLRGGLHEDTHFGWRYLPIGESTRKGGLQVGLPDPLGNSRSPFPQLWAPRGWRTSFCEETPLLRRGPTDESLRLLLDRMTCPRSD